MDSALLETLERIAAAVERPRVESPWLTRAEAAEYARCSPSEIDRSAEAGEITAHVRGRTPLFHREELDEAIKSGSWARAATAKAA